MKKWVKQYLKTEDGTMLATGIAAIAVTAALIAFVSVVYDLGVPTLLWHKLGM